MGANPIIKISMPLISNWRRLDANTIVSLKIAKNGDSSTISYFPSSRTRGSTSPTVTEAKVI